MYISFQKLVFVITNACPGRCAHCQLPSRKGMYKGPLNPAAAETALRSLAEKYEINDVMMFGGEPMLYPDTVCRLISIASELGIHGRGIITNGFVKADPNPETARTWAKALSESGITAVLLSADAFHEVNIPFSPVYAFAEELAHHKANIRLHPAWVRSKEDENEYNTRTKQALDRFASLQIEISDGNIVFPSGSASIKLRTFFEHPPFETFKNYRCGEVPYTSPLNDVHELHIEPNGDVTVCHFVIGNIYKEDIVDIVERYDPYANEDMAILMEAGPYALYEKKRAQGTEFDIEGIITACELCARLTNA